MNVSSLAVSRIHYGGCSERMKELQSLPIGSSLCVASNLQSVVQTPADTRLEERDTNNTRGGQQLVMVRH